MLNAGYVPFLKYIIYSALILGLDGMAAKPEGMSLVWVSVLSLTFPCCYKYYFRGFITLPRIKNMRETRSCKNIGLQMVDDTEYQHSIGYQHL